MSPQDPDTAVQNDLVQILDAFEVYSLLNYDRLPPRDKSYFLQRLSRAFEASEKRVLDDLTRADGVKLHFASSSDPAAKDANMPGDTFFRKSAFYANRTLVTFPF